MRRCLLRFTGWIVGDLVSWVAGATSAVVAVGASGLFGYGLTSAGAALSYLLALYIVLAIVRRLVEVLDAD